MISKAVVAELSRQANKEMFGDESEWSKPFATYMLGFITGLNLMVDGQQHTVDTILHHVELDFKKLLREVE